MVMKFRSVFEGKKRRRFTGMAIFTGGVFKCHSDACFCKSAYNKTAFKYSVMVA